MLGVGFPSMAYWLRPGYNYKDLSKKIHVLGEIYTFLGEVYAFLGEIYACLGEF